MLKKLNAGWGLLLVRAALLMNGCGDDDGGGEARDAEVTTQPDAAIASDAAVPSLDAGDAATVRDAAADATVDATADATVDATAPGKVEGDIELANKQPAVAADVAALVGTYTGNVGISEPSDGMPARYRDTCTISVASDGTLKVTADGNEISAALNGEELDTINSPNRDALSRSANAHGAIGNGSATVSVRVLRGHVVGASASTRTLENTRTNAVSCIVNDGNATVVGTGSAQFGSDLQYGGATAADFDSAWVGSVGNGTCSVEIARDGTLRLKKGAVDLSAKVAGDDGTDTGDVVSVYPSSVELQAGTLQLDGKRVLIKLIRVQDKWTAKAQLGQELLVGFEDCKDMVKL